MPDPRFFEELGPVALGELAKIGGGVLADPAQADRMIQSAAPLDRADASAVTFFSDKKYLAALGASRAGACFLPADQAGAVPPGCAAIITRHPQVAFTAAAERLHRARTFRPGGAAIDPTAVFEDDVALAPGVIVGAGASIGRGSRISAGAVIGPGVMIGRDCMIGPNCVVGFALIGDRVRLYAGAVIGEAGFGAAGGPTGVVDLVQLGRVILQDGVTVGANSCVDRGAYEDTVIGENTKLDNLVQIAHGVVIGRNCVFAAQVGVSGSSTFGDGCQVAGQVGIADHMKIGSGARLAGQAGVITDVPAGETWGGLPARPVRSWLRESVWLSARAAQRKERG